MVTSDVHFLCSWLFRLVPMPLFCLLIRHTFFLLSTFRMTPPHSSAKTPPTQLYKTQPEAKSTNMIYDRLKISASASLHTAAAV